MSLKPGVTCTSLLILLFVENVEVLNNGLALTPPMGWMSWGYYMCEVDCEKNPQRCLNEQLILSVADEFYLNGYQDAGYQYIIIDDCWAEKSRDSDGRLVPDRKRFPRGMKFIADYIHTRGLKFGLYSSAGPVTCMKYPGSKGHLDVDAQTFADWLVDYVKFDGCFVDEDYLNTVYMEFGDYLNKTGRPMVYSCSWPYYIEFIHKHVPNYKLIAETCNLWRNYHDVFSNWPNVRNIVQYYEKEYLRMGTYMGAGHWNDPDMLVIGTGALTEGQSRLQMAVYAMLSAPLIISCDMRKITQKDRRLLLNMNLISVGQDRLGLQAVPYRISKYINLWVKRHLPMKGDMFHSFSFLFVNLGRSVLEVSVYPSFYGLNCSDGYTVLDVFKDTYVRNITLNDSLNAHVPSEDVVFYTLYPL